MQYLSKEEERDLLRKHRAGDKEAGNRLYESLHRFGFKTVLQLFSNAGAPYDQSDVESIVNYGLARALHSFDLRRNVRLTTYTYWRLRDAFSEFMRAERPIVRTPAKALAKGEEPLTVSSDDRLLAAHSDPLDAIGEMEVDDLWDHLTRGLTKKRLDILKQLRDGAQMKDIAKENGCSLQNVTHAARLARMEVCRRYIANKQRTS